jgi:hypothetical protein
MFHKKKIKKKEKIKKKRSVKNKYERIKERKGREDLKKEKRI